MRKILSVLLMFMFVISFVVAIDDLMTLQGNIKESGSNLASGNISVYIFTTATGGNVIWNSTLNGKDDFNNSISDGKYDLLLGNVTGNELTLEYGQLYYLEMFVNEEGFSFNGSDRQVFQSSVGQINGSFIGANQINTTHFTGNLSLDQLTGYENLVFSNDSVTFDSGFNVTVGSGGWFFGIFNWVIDVASGSTSYFTFNGTTLTFDEDKLNDTIDSRSSVVANLSTKNIFDQAVNKTSNVLFGNLTVTGNLSVDEYIYHNGNAGNYIQFTTDALEISKPTTFAGTIHADTRISLGAAGGIGIVQAAENTGENVAGGSLQLYGGKSTGIGLGGDIQFFVSPAGDSGDSANDWLQALHIEGSNRNVGIGTTSPQQLLNVDGNVNITGGLNLSSYISCETLETDANGNVLCGTDADTGRVNVFDQLLNKTSNVEFANITSTGNLTVAGIAEFGGGWQAGGVTITGGDIYLESLFVVNITSLGVTNLEVNGSLFPELNNTFDLGNGSHIWRDGYFGGEVYIGGSAVSTWLYNQTDGDTVSDFNLVNFQTSFNLNATNIIDQAVNKTSNVLFGNLTVTGNFSANGSTLYVDPNTARVGIGTTSPGALLELGSTGGINLTINADTDNSGENDNPTLVLTQDGGVVYGRFGIIGDAGAICTGCITNAAYIEASGNLGTIDLQFVTGGDDDAPSKGTARMTILETGLVGIGTSSPSYNLHVNVSGNIPMMVESTGHARISLLSTHPSGDTSIFFRNYTDAINFGIGMDAGTDDFVISNSTDLNTPNLVLDHLTGNIGIGTASPDYELEVVGDIGIDANLYHNNDDDTYMTFSVDRARIYAGNQIIVDGDEDVGYARFGDGVLDVHVGSTGTPGTDATLFIGGSGGSYDAKVGIGTSSPTHELNVIGKVNFSRSGQMDLFLENPARSWFISSDNSPEGFRIGTGADSILNLLPTGEVGIGTASPGEKLTILDGSTNANTKLQIGNDARNFTLEVDGSDGDKFKINTNIYDRDVFSIDDASKAFSLDIDITGVVLNGGNLESNFTVKDTTSASALFVDGGTGLVGIGTSTPEYLLEVDGNFSANKTLFVTTAGNVGIGNATPEALLDIAGLVDGEYLRFSYSGDESYYNYIHAGMSGGDDTNNRIGFVIGNAARTEHNEVLSITGDEFVGIGTTTPATKLNIVNPADANLSTAAGSNNTLFRLKDSFEQSTNRNNFNIMTRREADSTSWLNSAYRLEKNIDENQNAKVWMEFINAGSTTDNLITFGEGGGVDNEWMRIDNGNVGIGSVAPVSGLHLNRSGNAILTLENRDNGATSGISFERQRLAGASVQGACIGLDSDTSTNNPVLFMDVDSSVGCGYSFGDQQRFSINANGNAFFGNLEVGIGIENPTVELHVVGDAFITSNIVVGDNVHEDAFNVFGNGALSDANDAGEIEGIDDVFISGNLEVHDKFFLTGGSAAIESGDIAENLLTVKGREAILCNGDPNCIAKSYEKELDFGEVVCINPKVGQTITRCTEANSHLVAGVLSNTTSLFMGNSGKYGNPVAVAGIVWTKVNIEGGEILPGDLLVTSSKPGYAMKNTNPKQGTLLGKAYDFCTPREANEEGECDILMFVALG